MDREIIAALGFLALIIMLIIRVPIGVAMGLVGIGGFAAVVNFEAALRLLALTPIRTVTDYNLAMIPLFILMGTFANATGMSREMFRAAYAWLGHYKGGLAMSTIASSGGFAAVSGSSIATAATMTKIALPEMRKYGYSDAISTGVIASGGTIGILIPPSIVLAVYGIVTEQDIGQLFIAGLIPGILSVLLYLVTVRVLAHFRPNTMPAAERKSWQEKFESLKGIWPMLLLFLIIVTGLYTGFVTPIEASGLGAVGAFFIGVVRRRLDFKTTMDCLVEALRTSVTIFFVFIGAALFGYFLTITQVPQNISDFLGGLPLSPTAIMLIILGIYLLLGCFLEPVSMILLTVPIMFPIVTGLGFDPIWFGIVVVVAVELGLITPPIGMNVFVMKSVAPDVELGTIYKGVTPFVITDFIRLGLLIAFPSIALLLPSMM
ncbi:MAG: TRAP transporter large permease [Saccharospirillum sp.]|nr:TRAP transporter large permease [Saccharospirillum sp.]